MGGRAMHGSYAPVRTVAPDATPVSLDEAKAHLRVDSDDEDDLISLLIDAAVSELDGWTGTLGRCLIAQTWRQSFDGFAPRLGLPMPAASVGSVVYTDADGAEQTLGSDQYALRHDALGSFVEPAFEASWPAVQGGAGSVRVTFISGSDADDVPAAIKAAILLRVGDLYANRDAGQDANPTINALLAPFRRVCV